MNVELTDAQVDLLIRSLDHSVTSGQFFFIRDETEALRDMMKMLKDRQAYRKKKDFKKCPYESHALDCECRGECGDR